MAKDGSTIIIGGLKQERETENKEEVPFLSRIPVLGQLFSSSTKTKTRTELLLMITPHIISGDELVLGYARDFGHKLDKEDQAYEPIAPEEMFKSHRLYRDYSDLKKKDVEAKKERWGDLPSLKPMKNLE